MFDRALEKYRTTETVQFTKDAILDLLRSLIPHIEESRIAILYQETMSRITSKDHKEQKKAYRVLEELCRGPSPAARTFLAGNLPQLHTALLASLSAASPSSQVGSLVVLFVFLFNRPGVAGAVLQTPPSLID